MRLYIRKVFHHDVTHEVSVTRDIVDNYFESQNSMLFTGVKSHMSGTVTINNATDPRFGGAYKSILDAEGGLKIDDLILTYKLGVERYQVEVIGNNDTRYNTYSSLFNNKERHAVIYTDSETKGLNYYPIINADEFERNRVFFGAPGTGKSFKLNVEKDKLIGNNNDYNYERVTFHPDYSYAGFVGTYKPVPKEADAGETISYEYVPGPFMRVLTKALKNAQSKAPEPFVLIVEEINRANVAAVFGDVFQLLDRDKNGASEYPIETSMDMRAYISKELGVDESEVLKIKIPSNLFIWATMNSADQGVFPMDTAFKRRWDFDYLGIDNGEAEIKGKAVLLGKGDNKRNVEWNQLRKEINNVLLNECNVNEDKLMGPFFIALKDLPDGNEIDAESFSHIFKNKVIMYLFDDAAKQKRATLFEGCENTNLYSSICNEFDEKGVNIFNESVRSAFLTAMGADDES